MPEANALKSEVFAAVEVLLDDKSLTVTEETPLLGAEGLLDSMKLVELCLALEDRAGELGFEFDWTSDAAMSRSRSMFRTAGALATEFIRQKELDK
jgi:acyl carrier protein